MLPLLATSAGVRLQVGAGIASHRERFGHWDGGFWLPECGHAPWLDPLLEEAGVHAVCLDLTDVLGYGSPAQLQPLRSAAGPLLVPIDRALMDLVWHNSGYPSAAAYRNTRRHTEYRHTPWAVDGAPYDPARGGRAGSRARARLRRGGGARGWRAAGSRSARSTPSCWGTSGTRGSTGWRRRSRRARWRASSCCRLDAALARRRRRAGARRAARHELGGAARSRHLERAAGRGARVARARGGAARARRTGAHPAPRALRELMALQASDWAFGVTRETAGPYSRERADGHAAELERALADPAGIGPTLRNLAPSLDLSNPDFRVS